MPLYVYEVVLPDGTGGEQFEVFQKMADPQLTSHPETGEPITFTATVQNADSDLAMMKAQLEQAPPPLRTLAPEVPPEVEDAVMRALQKDPADRFQRVAEFARALEGCAEADATAAMPRMARAPQGAPTLSRTAVNPALGQGHAEAAATAVRPVLPRGAWWKGNPPKGT